ncbi:MAG: 3-phosphoshikimate 1-carboxyvinyltransferase [Clostridia bacterium]|nr:3-phosphoshikimate 1-carboxyvinyltransferase [Clostridia bacterium]
MKIRVSPSRLSGEAKAPPSKSAAHRLLICAGLAKGESKIKNVAFSNDVLATLDCLKAIGAGITVSGDFVKIAGAEEVSPLSPLRCRESGSTLRFFIPIALTLGKTSVFTGSGRLFERPLGVYEEICRDQGLGFDLSSASLSVRGPLRAGVFEVPGNVSSQFVTGLLFALPLLEEDSGIRIKGKLESAPYVDMTLDALKIAGIRIERTESGFFVPGNQSYLPFEKTVEGDFSNAAFLDALALIGHDVKVTGLNENSLQGDRIYREYFGLIKNSSPVLPVDDCPDLAPILMATAAFFNGATLTGTARLRIKESDRGLAMKTELEKFGAKVKTDDNSITVSGGIRAPEETLSSHNDHRVAMSLFVLLTVLGGEIEGAEAAFKSYPDFYDVMKSLKAEVEINET